MERRYIIKKVKRSIILGASVPLIISCYRRDEEGTYSREEFHIAGIIRLYEYIGNYEPGRGFFCYLLKKRLVGLNAELKDESNPFKHGMGQYLGKVRRFVSDYEGRTGKMPPAKVVAEETGISMVSVENCLRVIWANDMVSLESPPSSEDGISRREDGNAMIKEVIPDPASENDYVDGRMIKNGRLMENTVSLEG